MNFDDIVRDIEQKVAADGYNFEKCATANDPVGPFHTEDMIAAIVTAGPNYTAIATLVRRRRINVARFIQSDQDMLEYFTEAVEADLDHIEHLQFAAAKGGDLKTGQFLLKTKARGRGYGTQAEAPPPPLLDPDSMRLEFFTRDPVAEIRVTRGQAPE